MKRQILISLLVMLSVSGLAGAAGLPWSGLSDSSLDGSAGFKQDELIVRFVDFGPGKQPPDGPAITGPWTRRAMRTMVSGSIVPGATVEKEYDDVSRGLAVVKLPQNTNVLDALLQFNNSANVLYAEPNYKYKLFRVPNDPRFPELWGLDNTGQTGGTPDADMDAPEAWDITTGSSDIIVAITDTGVDYAHPDLAANMWVNTAELTGAPGVDDDGNGYVDDIYGYDFAGAKARDPGDGDSDPNDTFYHGTHVAGSVGAVANNSEGVAGVAWNVKLMALKIFADDFVVEPEVFVSEAVEAIEYAVDNGAKIINASWGGDYFSQSLYDAIKEADGAGVLFVAAAGNDYGNDNDEFPVYPASFDLDNIISVMASDPNDMMAVFSNYGASSVDVAQPGENIVSTTPRKQNFPMLVFGVSPQYAALSGTSTSTPYVSGACTLIWSKYPSLPNRLVKGLLLKTVDQTLSSPRRNLSGGRINLHSALTLIPEGKAGRVLNTRDYPDNVSNLYPTIQQAIDDANDGDELIAEAGTIFIETIDFKGKLITLRSGDINDPNDPAVSPEDTLILGMLDEDSVVRFLNGEGPDAVLRGFTITWGNAEYGGGIRCDDASPTIADCIVTNNFAKFYGAGIDCSNGASPTITNCTISDNQTLGSAGIGGGINCEQASPVISNCVINNNFADSAGGGIACYQADPVITNCIITNNGAVFQGGGIDLEDSSPVITNCTILIDDPDASKDGGIYAYHGSAPVITNCILWGNGDDLSGCSATYSLIEDKDSGTGNIHPKDPPIFVTGPLGNYYLSQIAAGQVADSIGIDLGDPATDPALAVFTTRTDGIADEGPIDMGAHYPSIELLPSGYKMVELKVTVTGGPADANMVYVDPNSGLFRQYEVVNLTAHFDTEKYRIKSWTGTDDDSSIQPENVITMIADTEDVSVELEERPEHLLRVAVAGGHGTIQVIERSGADPVTLRRGKSYPEGTELILVATPDPTYIVDRWSGTDDDTSWARSNIVTIKSDTEVTVSFRRPKSWYVPGQYRDIGQAIEAAYSHGDKIIVSPGTYGGGYDFDGKAITITSERPDDPCCVAATVVYSAGFPAFIFQSGEGHDSVVNGLTIRGFGDTGPVVALDTGGTGAPGVNATGGAITCLNGSSPRLSNLVIEDVVARGQDGEDASFVFDPPSPPPDPLDPLDPNAPFPDPPIPDPNDPNHWAPADPNRPDQPDPNDPNAVANASADGFNGQNGADGLPGEPGLPGLDGAPGFPGGAGGGAYGGAMYFDGDSAPIIFNCTIVNCQAIGGDGGFGGQGQAGGDGQDGQPGQDGQDGQAGGEPLGDGAPGVGGNGGNGGAGGAGGNGGRGGDGGIGGDGGEALGGAIYFGPNCKPTIDSCKILGSSTRQGVGSRGGAAGNGGNGGVGAAPGAGAAGTDGGADGADGGEGGGGTGGDGGIGGDMGVNGVRSWAGAIFFGEDCQIKLVNTVISENTATNIVPTYTYGGGAGGNGGNGGDGEGAAPGGNGGLGGDGGAGGPPVSDPNDPNSGPGAGGVGGVGGAGGEDGEDGSDGVGMSSFTSGYGGANYYDFRCIADINDCTISFNASRQYDGSGMDGGAEYYQDDCVVVISRSDFIGNLAGSVGNGGAQYFNEFCSAQITDCNYTDNSCGLEGGGLYIPSDCQLVINNSSFIGNNTLGIYGSGGAIYGGGAWDWNTVKWRNGSTVTANNSYFANNKAAFGGAMYWHGEEADIQITDTVISNNAAQHGGGLFWSAGAPVISGCDIIGNTAETLRFLPNIVPNQSFYALGSVTGTASGKPTGGGGGLFCWSSDATIENCLLTGNSSSGSGGGVYFGGDPSAPNLRNCLVKGNSARLDGGGIVSYWHTSPAISNCTIAFNSASDPKNDANGMGGGLACAYESQTTVIDSILWGNSAVKGNQISLGSSQRPISVDRPTSLTVSYSDVQGGRTRSAVHVEAVRPPAGASVPTGTNVLVWDDSTNKNEDPLFVGNSFYLSQSPAQGVSSPCLDAGSALAANLGLQSQGTSSDGSGDTGVVDMGFHYSAGQGLYRLTVKVIGGEHGTVRPLGGLYERFSVVNLWATADTGYQVRWTGTDDDSSDALTNTVTMDSHKTVSVEFARHVGNTVTVPGNYPTIQEAVNNAKDGDTIVVDPGTYFGGYSGISLVIDKAVTITSRNPDDPNIVSATIIDGYVGTNAWTHIGVGFASNVTSATVLDGITIQNCGGAWANGDDGDRNNGHPNGEDGAPGYGAGILIDKGASPIIKNCILRNNLVRSGDGGDGENADATFNAGRGGWAGWARGGGVYCGPNSSPQFINCIIENNVVRSGDAGDGGDWDTAATGQANYGGNYSRSLAVYYDPNSLDAIPVNELWKAMRWDFAVVFGPYYDEPNLTSFVGDYRWYSAYGGGAFCDIGSNVSFVNCEIRGNRTLGGLSGIGGAGNGGRNLEPLLAFEMPTFGAGVYCAAKTTVTFTDCTFEGNIASGVQAGVDPNHRLDPYVGYGGGVCAEKSAAIAFVDCNFVDNDADSGGGIYLEGTDVAVIDCNLVANTALRGGGLLSVDSTVDIMGGYITNNTATADVNDPNNSAIGDILASGAGLYSWLGGVSVRDCNLSGNLADFSGGAAYLRDVDGASFVNNLVLGNGAGRDGGGISVNWFTDAVISNCTFANNAAPGNIGQTDKTGFGGALSLSHQSNGAVTDSIFWNNFGLKGNAIAVGTGAEFDRSPSVLTVSFSDIKDGRNAVWVESGSRLNWDAGNIDKDPLFADGLAGPYYLSQTDAGQGQNSPCVDAGSDFTSQIGLIGYTTHTDNVQDTGKVDMGYHHPQAQPCRLCDLEFDGIINFHDFAVLADAWLEESCSKTNAWCQGADITSDRVVDLRDVLFMADCWLVKDDIAPIPNPSRWDEEPTLTGGSITMTAETAYDAWGWDVEYYFDCIDSDSGLCHDSGWRNSPTFTDSGLVGGVEYGYRFRTRDGVGNETEWSPVRFAGIDGTPPAPAPYIFTIIPASPTSISMTATTAFDDSEVEYYFENTTVGGHDSGWQDDPNYTDIGLDPNTEYSYRVKARDKSSSQNETDWSNTVSMRTLVAPDLIPPLPDPMEWDPTVDPNGFDGTPREEFGGNGTFDYYAVMLAVVAVDAGGGPVEYFFECTTEHGFSSGWIATPDYRVLVGRSGQGHLFRVKARDQFGNETGWSPIDEAD